MPSRSGKTRARPARKKIHHNDIIGQQGVNLIEKVVLQMGFLWYPTGGVEAGVDGFIEIRDAETGEVTNCTIQVQSKATRNEFTAETETGFTYLCAERDLNYWMQGNAPIILVVSRPHTGEAFWVSIKDYFKDTERFKSRKIHFDKRQHRFEVNSKPALIALALPTDAGAYFAPPPKRETLYSNLLRVSSFPEYLYVAETDFRFTGELWAELATIRDNHPELARSISGEWLLKNQRLMSFINLEESPWDQICDLGTLEKFSTKDWAYSNDPDKQKDFVRLLNQCLRGLTDLKGLRFSREHKCYYVRGKKDLSGKNVRTQYRYRSVTNETKRNIFLGYGWNEEKQRYSYFRHSAFNGYFVRYDDTWYLEITPTYYFTWNGKDVDRFYEERLKGIKRLEKNNAIRGQVIMWAEMLTEREGLFTSLYPFLSFDRLMTFELDSGINDDLWLPYEEAEKRKELSDSEPLLFD